MPVHEDGSRGADAAEGSDPPGQNGRRGCGTTEGSVTEMKVTAVTSARWTHPSQCVGSQRATRILAPVYVQKTTSYSLNSVGASRALGSPDDITRRTPLGRPQCTAAGKLTSRSSVSEASEQFLAASESIPECETRPAPGGLSELRPRTALDLLTPRSE
jgi:hypothetical protein